MRRKLLLLLLIGFNTIALAEKVPVAPEPAWLYKIQADNTKRPAANTISNGYFIELADHQQNLATQTEYRHVIRHIVNESGVQNASEVSVTFAPEYQKVYYHKVTLWRDGKIISELSPSQIKVVQEESDASDFQYNGLKRAFVILKDVQKEDRIEFAYSITGFNPVFTNHFSDKIYFVNSTAISNYFETIIVPANRKLSVKLFNNAPVPAESQQGSAHIYHWNNPAIKMQESQPDVPGWFDNYPYFVASEFGNWKEVIDWGVKLFNNYNYPLPEELKKKISQWQATANGDKDLFANMAIRFVQDQVRYLGLEIGAHTHQPHTPADVYRQRFGDCKDKALLLSVLLRQAGIPAYVALVNTTKRSQLQEAVPSASEFDHAIVAIERSSGYIYVDATAAYQRGDLASLYIPDYGYALLLREGFIQLQPVEPGYTYTTNIEEKLVVPFSDSCRLSVATTYSGGAADNIRGNLADASVKDMEDTYREYYVKTYDGIRLASPIVVNDDSSKNELVINESYTMPSLWRDNEKGKKGIDVFAKPVYEQIPDPASAYGGAPVAISFPRTFRYVLEINMPEDWPFSPEEFHVKNDSYQFDFVPEITGNIISLRYYYKTFKDHIPANEVAAYKSDYKKIESLFDFNLYYNTGDINKPVYSSKPAFVNNTNPVMVLLALLFSGALMLLIWFFNKKSVDVPYTAETGWPLGGWVIVLGVSLGLSGIVQLVEFAGNEFFNLSSWKALGEGKNHLLQWVSVTEMLLSLFWICGMIALLFWFINRRDIFPRMFIGYIVSLLIGQLLLLILYSIVPYPATFGDMSSPIMLELFRTVVYGAIWITYILRSERVKSTFLQPYKMPGIYP